jgi:hypothetical protein
MSASWTAKISLAHSLPMNRFLPAAATRAGASAAVNAIVIVSVRSIFGRSVGLVGLVAMMSSFDHEPVPGRDRQQCAGDAALGPAEVALG